MEDGGNWFLYAAMIVIAFISWIFNKIQESTAARQRDQEIEQYQEERSEEAIFGKGPSQSTPPPVPSPPVPSPAEQSMRKLMEALGGTAVEAPPPPVPRDIPVSRETAKPPARPSTPQLSPEEKAALERVRRREEAGSRKRRSSGRLGDLSVADLVRDPDGIRKAVVLREVLDKPRAERPWEYT